MILKKEKQILDIAITAYTAGLLDGEGSIQINPSTNHHGISYWNLTIQISNNCQEVLVKLKEVWNIGHITSFKSRGTLDRTCYNWRIFGPQSEFLLNKIMPYLIIKKEHAKVALEFRKYIKKGQRLSKEISEKRNILALKMKKLNQLYGKGIAKPLQKEVR